MKTVSGTIVSTKSVSLSKAANILSKFVTSDNGASQTVSAYLRRASAAFDELAYFKKHHKLKKNRSKDDVSTKSDISHRSSEEEFKVVENGGVNLEYNHEAIEVDERANEKGEGNLKRKKKKTDGSLGSEKKESIETKGGDVTVKEKSEEKKKKKKRKNTEVDGGENGNLVTPEKKKRRKAEA